MDERFADVGRDISLCYEDLGAPDGDPLVLVMGLGTQMVGWPDGFCAALVAEGFRVIRFDNRDIGRSTKLRKVRPPKLADIALRRKSAAGYRLTHMAGDVAGLLDHLELERAHVVGASMGGMIAQTLAAERPDRVLSLASIMSNTGHRLKGQPAPSIYPMFLRKPARTPEELTERVVGDWTRIGSPGFPRDEPELRRMITLSIERSGGGDTAGTGRQLMAILASGDRTAQLRRIVAPTVVIHGTADRLVQPSGAKATAAAIPGAELVWIEGMGHDLPRDAWPQIVGAVTRNARRAATVTA